MNEYQDIIEYLDDLEELKYSAIWEYDYPDDIINYEPVSEVRMVPALITLGIMASELVCLPITILFADRLDKFNEKLLNWSNPTVYKPIERV